MGTSYEYQCKTSRETWESVVVPYTPLGWEHKFSPDLEYRFRLAFVPGYYRARPSVSLNSSATYLDSRSLLEALAVGRGWDVDDFERVNITSAE